MVVDESVEATLCVVTVVDGLVEAFGVEVSSSESSSQPTSSSSPVAAPANCQSNARLTFGAVIQY